MLEASSIRLNAGGPSVNLWLQDCDQMNMGQSWTFNGFGIEGGSSPVAQAMQASDGYSEGVMGERAEADEEEEEEEFRRFRRR